jgi:hypothetical protein
LSLSGEPGPFADIRRGDVTRLLDKIEDSSGKRVADIVLSIFRKLANSLGPLSWAI